MPPRVVGVLAGGMGPGRHQGGVAIGPLQNHNGTVTRGQTFAVPPLKLVLRRDGSISGRQCVRTPMLRSQGVGSTAL